jgi:hypothetical protein
MMSQYWFKPRANGYGSTPASWKGWAAIAAYLAMILVLALPLFAWPADLPDGPRAWQVATALGMAVLATFAFFHTARAKTDGQWRWRWEK